MDPTMGETAGFGIEPGASAYLGGAAEMQAAQSGADAGAAEASTVSTEVVVAAPIYPVGIVDFNKPFEIIDENDNEAVFEDVKILTVLQGNSYPVVVIARLHGEQIIAQFDTDGDEQNGEYKIENIDPGPRTVFVRLYRDGRDITADEDVYDSADEARGAYSSGDLIGVFPVVIPPRDGSAAVIVDGVEGDEESDDLEGTEEVGADLASANPDARWVNGKLYAPGDAVRAYRHGFGERSGTVVKTRQHAYKTLFIQPNDGTNPYWALNKNIRNY